MAQIDSLVLLVRGLSSAEKRVFRSGRRKSDHMVLFGLIEKNGNLSPAEIKVLFRERLPGANFNSTVSYLYKLILDCLLSLNENYDHHYILFNKILKARVLFGKSLYKDALVLLGKVIKEARTYQNQNALLYASRLELEYLLFLDLPEITETELLGKHFRISQLLNEIRKINELSSLHELLKHRILFNGNIRDPGQKNLLNDLVMSELSLVSANKDSFEIKKLHQLFQSNYMIGVGDYNSPLNSFRELNRLFENNPHLWANPPYYYVSMVEGILGNLRAIKNYGEIYYFTDRLRNVKHPSSGFQYHVSVLIFLYELVPYLDRGDFPEAAGMVERNRKTLLAKTDQLPLMRRAEISLYLSLIHFGMREYRKAQKVLVNEVIKGNAVYNYPLYRTIRLVNLMIQYELGNREIIRHETRSIKREISREKKSYRTERLMLWFINKEKPHNTYKRRKMWQEIEDEVSDIRQDVFETHLLQSFDFTAWIESKLFRLPLKEVLTNRG